MLPISKALLFFETGFLQVMFSVASIQVQPGQSVTMWCAHDIHVSGNLCWFKQTDGDVPRTIAHMLYTESLQTVQPTYFNGFTKDQLDMNQFRKNTSLTIKHARISDSGFYFCGAPGYRMTFGNGTRLEVKDSHFPEKNISETNVTSDENDTGSSKKDDEESPVSTEECSRDIYFTLTLLFGGIIFFTCIIPLIMGIINEHKKQKDKKAVSECQTQQHEDEKENDSVEYAAVHFKRPRTAGRQTEDTTAVHTDTTSKYPKLI
ncbi:uncharacterized protein [Pseudorasbora parva]|uniref:uncharacterized protein n=1 Tax=Pseudorasbora parva TaxID=51549 RepID=UPI00351EAFCF